MSSDFLHLNLFVLTTFIMFEFLSSWNPFSFLKRKSVVHLSPYLPYLQPFNVLTYILVPQNQKKSKSVVLFINQRIYLGIWRNLKITIPKLYMFLIWRKLCLNGWEIVDLVTLFIRNLNYTLIIIWVSVQSEEFSCKQTKVIIYGGILNNEQIVWWSKLIR